MRARAQEKPHFWKRKPSIVKVHMLLLAHLARADVPRSLQADARFLLQKAPLLLEEMVKIANLPRPPAGYGWLSPTVGALEMMQCLTRAQPLHVRKTAPGGKARPSARCAAHASLESLSSTGMKKGVPRCYLDTVRAASQRAESDLPRRLGRA